MSALVQATQKPLFWGIGCYFGEVVQTCSCDFTIHKPFNRLVNFLNLRNNAKKSRCAAVAREKFAGMLAAAQVARAAWSNASGTGGRCDPSPLRLHGRRVRNLRGWDRPRTCRMQDRN